MRAYFYLMTALVIAVGMAGCKCSKKATQQQQVTEIHSDTKVVQVNDDGLRRDPGEGAVIVHLSELPITSGTFALPNVIIYKTKADYSQHVPVGLNEERTALVSYPGQTDLKGQLPILLEHGFLLDRRGINSNVAFLKYTYDEYMTLETIPSIAELFNNIIDADPLTEMYHCGKISDFRQGEVAEQLNDMLKKCDGKPEEIFRKLK